jgi:formate dehydrogenase (coenzyme F420) alpha subunit
MGVTGRSSVVHFHSVTHWTYTGKLLNGVRLIQIHPKVAQNAGITNGSEIIVESPRGSIRDFQIKKSSKFSCGVGILPALNLGRARMPIPQDEEFNFWNSLKGTALIWEGIREDTIFVPNGFGLHQKMAQELGTPYYEAANQLIDDQHYDNLSGQQAFKCFACRVLKA